MKKRILYALLFTTIVLFLLDRSAAYFYKPNADSTEVILYATSWCPYCNSLRIHLQTNNIPFAEHDIEKSLSGIAGFWALRARGVPVLVIGPKVVYGYDITTINKGLIDLGYNLKHTK